MTKTSFYCITSLSFTGVDPSVIQRAAAGLPSNIYNTLAQVAGVTPGVTPRVTPGFTPGYTPRAGFTPQVPGFRVGILLLNVRNSNEQQSILLKI